jgi:predicted small secreted protein
VRGGQFSENIYVLHEIEVNNERMSEMKTKKKVLMILTVILAALCLSACSDDFQIPGYDISDRPTDDPGSGTGQISYEKITAAFPSSERFYVTNVEDKGNTLLLQGLLYEYAALSADLFNKAKSGELISINGESYRYEPGDTFGRTPVLDYDPESVDCGRLYAVNDIYHGYTVYNVYDVKGSYKLYPGGPGVKPIWAKTDQFREIEIEKTMPCIIQNMEGSGDPISHILANSPPASQVFANFQKREPTDGAPVDYLLTFEFDIGKCSYVYFY